MTLKKIIKLLAVLLLGVLLGGYFFLGDEKINTFFSQFVKAMDKAGLPVKAPDADPLVTQILKVPSISVPSTPVEIMPTMPLTKANESANKIIEQQSDLNNFSSTNSTEIVISDTAQSSQIAMPSVNGTMLKKAPEDSVVEKEKDALLGKNETRETAGINVNENTQTGSITAPHLNEPIIIFNSANKKVAGNALRGEISSTESKSLPLVRQDGTIPLSFIDDLASFLVTNYWPQGTHPSAQTKDFSTVTLGWINNRYSSYFVNKGNQNIDPTKVRARVLSYVFKPVMVNALNSLYKEKFISSLQRAGFSRFGQDTKGFQQVSGMFSLYSLKVQSVASAFRGYLRSPEARQKSKILISAEASVQDAYRKYNEIRFSNHDKDSLPFRSAVKKYQNAIWTRDQAKTLVASAMRRAGDTRSLSEDELNFVALWLTRRDQNFYDGISAFADVLDNLSAQMKAKAQSIELENKPLVR